MEVIIGIVAQIDIIPTEAGNRLLKKLMFDFDSKNEAANKIDCFHQSIRAPLKIIHIKIGNEINKRRG